ncbi:MAG: hypothetical protein ABIQ18_44210 [Umezawaea sp.]
MRRALQRVDGDAVDAAITTWTRTHRSHQPTDGPVVIAIDGKPCLAPAASTDPAACIYSRRWPTPMRSCWPKSWSTPRPRRPKRSVDLLDLTGVIVTADAMHTIRATRILGSPACSVS